VRGQPAAGVLAGLLRADQRTQRHNRSATSAIAALHGLDLDSPCNEPGAVLCVSLLVAPLSGARGRGPADQVGGHLFRCAGGSVRCATAGCVRCRAATASGRGLCRMTGVSTNDCSHLK